MTDLTALKAANAKRWDRAKLTRGPEFIPVAKRLVAASLTHDRLLQVLFYEPEAGRFIRRERTASAIKIGDVGGWVNRNGYRYIEVCGKRFLAQRLAWFYMTGEWPVAEVDHKDCDRDNNRWANLRQANRIQNLANSRIKASNTSGYKGVSYSKRDQKFTAKIRHDGRRRSLGHFDTAAEAHAAYVAKSIEIHGEFARVA